MQKTLNTPIRLLLLFALLCCAYLFSGTLRADAAEVTGQFTMKYNASGTENEWVRFSGKVEAAKINCLDIRGNYNNTYYIQYATKNNGKAEYPPVYSYQTGADKFAGWWSRPIQYVKMYAINRSNAQITTQFVVMYRVKANGKWLSWVSNASRDWQQYIFNKYQLGGSLDTSGDGYAGYSNGILITGFEVRIFYESSLNDSANDHVIANVPFLSQLSAYPTGCESVSTVMALRYAGVNITVDTFIDNYLEKTAPSTPFDPSITFGGNPRGTTGCYGCYSPVIKKTLNEVLKGKNKYAKLLIGQSLSSLVTNYIDHNIPVILWASIGMATPYNGNSWTYQGRTIQWIRPEHCLLLIGYNDSYYIFNDPMQSSGKTYYSKAAVETAYAGLYRQAVVILNGAEPAYAAPQANALPLLTRGDGALWLQTRLNAHRHSLPVSGYFDEATQAQLKIFQRRRMLPATGLLDNNTISLLSADPANDPAYQNGDANFDGVTNILDLVTLKKYAADNTGTVSVYYPAIDFDDNDTINGADIVSLCVRLMTEEE